MKAYFVYMMASASRTLYTGVTGNLERRISQHRSKLLPGFTSPHNIGRPVYFEVSSNIVAAIAREKQIKSWSRTKNVALIESVNRDWKDSNTSWHGAREKSRLYKPQPERDSWPRSE